MMETKMKIFSSTIPAVRSGEYKIITKQCLERDGNVLEQLEKVQEFLVDAPRDSLAAGELLGTWPPNEGRGDYNGVLPHVLLKNAHTPWLRAMEDEKMPWMALLLFRHDEIQKEEEGCIYLTPDVFLDVMPKLDEIPYLAHCRQVETANKAEMDLNDEGMFAVITANRKISVPGTGTEEYRLCLVSLENMENLIGNPQNVWGIDSILLIVLASSRFVAVKGDKAGFYETAEVMLHESERTMMLALHPRQDTDVDESIVKRLKEGYVPAAYHFRTGEDGFAWYRSPFLPFAAKWEMPEQFFYSRDQALIYDRKTGIFDCSLAAAWEAGRLAGLSDSSFGSLMMRLRKRGQEFIDILLHRIVEKMKAEGRIDMRDAGQIKGAFSAYLGSMTEEDLKKLTSADYPQNDLIQKIAENETLMSWGRDLNMNADVLNAYYKERKDSENSYNLKELLLTLMEEDNFRKKLSKVMSQELSAVGVWLFDLFCLRQVPFEYLVPLEEMLPSSAIRFFYMDAGWCKALMDGAMSLGIDCTRQEVFNRLITGILWDMTGRTTDTCRCGFLMRGNLVRNWTTLEVYGYCKDGTVKKPLRQEHLSGDILLCIWEGTICKIDMRQPVEHLEFMAVDCMRGKDGTILNLAPEDSNGALSYLSKQTGKARQDMTSADIAVCLINQGSAIEFIPGEERV